MWEERFLKMNEQFRMANVRFHMWYTYFHIWLAFFPARGNTEWSKTSHNICFSMCGLHICAYFLPATLACELDIFTSDWLFITYESKMSTWEIYMVTYEHVFIHDLLFVTRGLEFPHWEQRLLLVNCYRFKPYCYHKWWKIKPKPGTTYTARVVLKRIVCYLKTFSCLLFWFWGHFLTFWGKPGNPVNSHTSSLFWCQIFPCPLHSRLMVFRWSIC